LLEVFHFGSLGRTLILMTTDQNSDNTA